MVSLDERVNTLPFIGTAGEAAKCKRVSLLSPHPHLSQILREQQLLSPLYNECLVQNICAKTFAE